jgi:ubiquinone biosynthesis protein
MTATPRTPNPEAEGEGETPPISPRGLSAASHLLRRAGREKGFRRRTSGLEAAVRIGAFVSALALRHGLGRLGDAFVAASQRPRRRAARMATTARASVGMLGALKGAFVKAGQFASVRHDVLPQAAVAVLSELQSRVPPLPFETIRERVEAELGASLASLFENFEHEPLGAASIAQVHRARLPGGEIVAVKVQYPWVRAALPADLAVLGFCLRVGSWWLGRPIPDRDALLHEFRRGLLEELDFTREAHFAEEIARNLADEPQIAVPRIVASHSTSQVLTMTAYDTIPVSPRAGLEARGISPARVLELLGRAYAKQIFADGLFHADPHPGNLFVIDEPDAATRPRVLFVDFGLSKRLSPELRRDLRQGIYALLQSDLDGFVERMDTMGMIAPGAHEGVRQSVAAMFERLRESGGALSLPGQQLLGLKEEAKQLLRETPGLQLPNDLLLYARTLTYLFALGEQLAPEVDLLKLSTPYLLKFLATRD